jgi:membrane-bound lytic murein transglycosylase B
MGMAQFMPSSWQKYAVDFDGDGRIDLFGSSADAIGSVANYLAAFGWTSGMPTHFSVALDMARADLPALLEKDIVPSMTPAQMQALGALLPAAALAHSGLLALVELPQGLDANPSYVVGTDNFYTVTRYNWSSFYALSVIELGQAVQANLPAPKTPD